MKIYNPKLLVISIGISQLAGIVGSIFTTSEIAGWYVFLNKPSFNPPNWLFGPVWIILYTLMGISLYLVWSKGYKESNIKRAVNIFLVHLVVNSIWSIAFFGLHYLGIAFMVIINLWLMILYLIRLFYGINKNAAYLLIPYLIWVSFASLLNFSIWQLN
ncbi:TspO/MBR family protein [Patescibacteria group bacterium]